MVEYFQMDNLNYFTLNKLRNIFLNIEFQTKIKHTNNYYLE